MIRQRLPYWLVAGVALVFLFMHAPLLVLVLFSFNDSKFSVGVEGFHLQVVRAAAERQDIIDGLYSSLTVGLASTLIATVLGTLMALAIARHSSAAAVDEALLYVPIVTPEIVVGISLLILFVAVQFPLGLMSITVAHVAFNISFVAVVVHARLQGMDRNLEEAAMILGADEITAFFRVTVPQLWPGILSGAMLAFTMSFDDYVITSFVAGTGGANPAHGRLHDGPQEHRTLGQRDQHDRAHRDDHLHLRGRPRRPRETAHRPIEPAQRRSHPQEAP
jgi:spermidine/putrescine transport system permease protein